jgi:hypothetical protein
MSKRVHPEEMELARWAEGGEEAGERVGAHVRRCVQCQSTIADYRWLRSELGAALTSVARAVPVPRPEWWSVQGRLRAGRRQATRWRVSAVSGFVLAMCLMLALSPVWGSAAAAQALLPQVRVARVPVTAPASGPVPASASGRHPAWGLTPTPVVSSETVTPSPTPALVLPPTPEREA